MCGWADPTTDGRKAKGGHCLETCGNPTRSLLFRSSRNESLEKRDDLLAAGLRMEDSRWEQHEESAEAP